MATYGPRLTDVRSDLGLTASVAACVDGSDDGDWQKTGVDDGECAGGRVRYGIHQGVGTDVFVSGF